MLKCPMGINLAGCFRSDGRPMARSAVSDILKEKNKWLALDISGPGLKRVGGSCNSECY